MKNLVQATRLALALVFASVPFEVCGSPPPPAGLLVNGVESPLAIDRDAPRFTWMSGATARAERQTAYQVLVSSTPERLAANTGDCWDSGKIISDQSASVQYAGRPLPPATRFWWKVRVWDQTGKPGPYSTPAHFDTGLNQNEWTASFLWDGTTNPNNFAYFRKAFALARQPRLAKVYVMAHNDYLLYLNGQMLGRGPARCDPYHYGQYNAYDITRLLRNGTNVFAALAHWQGTFNDSGINARPGFILEARFDYPDGSSSTVGTDSSWKVLAQTPFIETNAAYFPVIVRKPGPPPKNRSNIPHLWTIPPEGSRDPPEFVEADWGNGGASNRAALQFDSRLEPAGWRQPAFDDSRWAPATVVDRSGYHLFAQSAPLEKEQAELKPVSITLTNGVWLVDEVPARFIEFPSLGIGEYKP